MKKKTDGNKASKQEVMERKVKSVRKNKIDDDNDGRSKIIYDDYHTTG